MFQEIIQQVNDLNVGTRRFKRLLEDYDAEIDFSVTAFRDAIRAAELVANDMLLTNMRAAVATTNEFNTPALLEPLEEVCSLPQVIDIYWEPGQSVSVQILMDNYAGTVDDYMQGVQAAREILGIKSNDSALASYLWRELYYKPAREGKRVVQKSRSKKKGNDGEAKPGKDITDKLVAKYWHTISTRRGNFGSPAPYWYIINYGSSSLEGAGTPYPNQPPTRFVEKTEQALLIQVTEDFRWRLEALSEEFDQEISTWLEDMELYEPGHIFTELRTAKGWYQVYKTRTGKFGFKRATAK